METFDELIQRYDGRDDSAVLHEALVAYIGVRTDYEPDDTLWEELEGHATSSAELKSFKHVLEAQPAQLDDVAEAVLRWAHDEGGDQIAVKSAIETAKEKQAFVELAALTVVGIYGLYLIATGGLEEVTVSEEVKGDGSRKKVVKKKYHSIGGVLQKAISIFVHSHPTP